MTTGQLAPLHTYAGVPNTARGEPTRINADPTGATDRIVYGSGRTAVVRSASDPLAALTFTAHTGTVTAARFSPDGSVVASADEAGYVRVWIPDDSLKQKHELGVSAAPIRDIAFSPDMKFMAIGSDARGGYAKVVKYPGGASAGSCAGHQKRVVSIDIRPKAEGAQAKVISCGEDFSVGMYVGPPVKETQVPVMLKHHKNFANAARFAPDAKNFATCSSDKTLVIVDAESGEVSKTIDSFEGSVLGLAWNKDATAVVTAAADKTVRVVDVASGQVTFSVKIGNDVMDMQNGCTWVPKTNELVSVSLRGDLNVIEVGNQTPKLVMRGHAKTVVGLAAVGATVYSADYSGLLVPWEMGKGAINKSFTGKGPVAVCAIAANDKVIATVGQDGKVFVVPTETLKYEKPLEVKGGALDVAVPSSSTGSAMAVMINESRLVVVGQGNAVLAQKDFERSEKGSSVAVSADGSLIAYGMEVSGGSGELRFLQFSSDSLAKTGETIQLPSPPNRMAITPSAGVVVVGEKSRRVRMYEPMTGKKVDGGGVVHNARCDAVSISADGKYAVTGGLDGSIAVWPIGSDDEPRSMVAAHRGGVTGVSFVDDKTIVSGGNDSCLRSWTLA